jgi:hypothetical protein
MALPEQPLVVTGATPSPDTSLRAGDVVILHPQEVTAAGPLVDPSTGDVLGPWSWRFPEHISEMQKLLLTGFPPRVSRDYVFGVLSFFTHRPMHILHIWQVHPACALRGRETEAWQVECGMPFLHSLCVVVSSAPAACALHTACFRGGVSAAIGMVARGSFDAIMLADPSSC